MDVRTIRWNFGYFTVNWATYYVAYAVQARLVESNGSPPVPENTDKSPSYDALMNGSARSLKQELAAIASQCVRKFESDMRF